MSLFNFGADDAENGSLNNMLNGVGIDDVGSFVNEFRQVAGSSGSEESGNSFGGMFQGAMNAYKMFSGGKGKSGGGGSAGGGNFFNQMGSTVENAQKMYEMYQKFDRNGDGKIAADDIEVILKEAGLGVASPYLAKALFESVDQNHNGTLDFTDIMALATMLNKLYSQYGVTPP